MQQYFHSVRLNKEKCKGCTNCIKHCPTEAIRVRDGKAVIIEEKCIDCGECIRICPNNAKFAEVDNLNSLRDYKFKVALPAPSVYGQFKDEFPEEIDNALYKLGFDFVVEVPMAAELVTIAISEYLKKHNLHKPVISSACPAVVGLIQVRFPLLTKHIIPMDSPMAIAAKLAKNIVHKKSGLDLEAIGAFFITPCPAKATVIRQPHKNSAYGVDGALAISHIYGELLKILKQDKPSRSPAVTEKCFAKGIGWGRTGGEIISIGGAGMLAVDGIRNVIALLEEVERGELNNLSYLECQACAGGCVGGPLVVKNPYVAKARLESICRGGLNQESKQESKQEFQRIKLTYPQDFFTMANLPEVRKLSPLDADLDKAIKKMENLEKILDSLPGLDCGSCGSPTCRALAEDIVRGLAFETDCTFVLRKKMQVLTEEVLELARKVPPAMGKTSNELGEK